MFNVTFPVDRLHNAGGVFHVHDVMRRFLACAVDENQIPQILRNELIEIVGTGCATVCWNRAFNQLNRVFVDVFDGAKIVWNGL